MRSSLEITLKERKESVLCSPVSSLIGMNSKSSSCSKMEARARNVSRESSVP
jgi:hypothetical protein